MNTTSWFGGWRTAETAVAPLMFLRERLATNRQVSQDAASAMAMAARQQGTTVQDIMATMSRFPGGIYGTPSDLMSLFSAAPALGASFPFGNRPQGGIGGRQLGQGVRAGGFLAGIAQMQQLNPGASVAELTGTLGGYAANTQAQQMGAYLTGGAFSMIAAGGRQKTVSEWAESILQWLKGLRAGDKRNKDFTYGELMAQYFPGSNIDAWFQANGVPQNMRQYWWTYVLGKASHAKDQTTGGQPWEIGAQETNLAYQRLRATSELTRTEFGMGAAMTPAYLNKELTNRWFNQLMGVLQTQMMPALAGGPLGFVQFLPDTIEDILMNAIAGRARNTTGDVGDIGDSGGYGTYGTEGGTGMGGLSLNLKSKLGPMLAANPRLRISSGLRDTAMQSRLKKRGFSRVSGKASAHTRGDAADLGPPSEYGWIVRNARKFGLKSGIGAGEPWHVGVGDVTNPMSSLLTSNSGGSPIAAAAGVDTYSPTSDPMDAIWEVFKGIGGSTDAALQFMGPLMGALFGKLFQMSEGKPGPVFNPNLYNELVAKTQQLGLPSTAPGTVNPRLGLVGSGLGGGLNVGGGTISGDLRSRGIAVAKLASKYWSGDDLVKMVAISQRESNWNPNAKNPNTSDRGLFQINGVNYPFLTGRGIMSSPSAVNEMFDPARNTAAANALFDADINSQYQGFGPWPKWVQGADGKWRGAGNPMHNTNVPLAREVIAAAGVGDVEAMQFAAMIGGIGKRAAGGNTFNNTFILPSGGGAIGGGGVDARRSATLIANYLEDEMARRAARSN
jgi:hypothetical protein